MFLQNERGLGVKNGTLGTIEQVSAQSMTVQTDDGRSVRFDLKDYNRIDHGYAATIHKAQGMTVDRTHVLATPGMDAHSSYVALSRHRDGMDAALWPRRFCQSGPPHPHPVARPGQGHGLGLRARRSGAKLCRAARDHLPRARCRDRAQGRAGEGAQHVRWPAPVCRSCARMADGGRAGNAGKGKERYGSRAARNRSAGKEGGGRPGSGAASRPAPRRSSAMPEPWMRSSICRSGAARPARRR